MGKKATLWVLSATALAVLFVVPGAAVAGNGYGNDRQPDWNDAQCDDDEGTGNDHKCLGTSSSGSGKGGHGYGNDRQPDWNDAQCDDDEGRGNDDKCM